MEKHNLSLSTVEVHVVIQLEVRSSLKMLSEDTH